MWYKYMNKKNIVFIQCIEPHLIATILINIDILLLYIFQVFQHLNQVIWRPTSVEAFIADFEKGKLNMMCQTYSYR
jgi:hypothetical protein